MCYVQERGLLSYGERTGRIPLSAIVEARIVLHAKDTIVLRGIIRIGQRDGLGCCDYHVLFCATTTSGNWCTETQFCMNLT